MPNVLAARITCSNCQRRFETPVEQVLDVRADPSAKMRVLNGVVNTVVCPHCNARGVLNLPYLYHDPEKQLALIYMPMDAARDHLERQVAIGKFTKAVMDSLPAEERKAYLLQPQVFLTPDNVVSKVLEADGVTPQMVEEQRSKATLLQRIVEASSDEVLESLIKDHDAEIDMMFLRLLSMNMEAQQQRGDEENLAHLAAVRSKVLELSTEGRAAAVRGAALEALRAESTREKLVELLVQATDVRTRQTLVTYGRSLLDYVFFQGLTAKIEGTSDAAERERLTQVRREILDTRDRIDADVAAVQERRAALLRDLLISDDPEKLARHRFAEMDEMFMTLLRANIEQATQAKNEQALTALRGLWALTMKLIEESTPPALRLLSRLMAAESEQQIEEVLQANRALVSEQMVKALESMESSARADGETETADRLAKVLPKARAMLLLPA